ncbi:MAG: hypothetical protein ACXAEX_02085 [Promethearchaeota archaeon]|jgi:hypothetical protein
MISQPPSGPVDPFNVGEYEGADVMLWVVAIAAVVMGILLLFNYLNNKKRYHLVWAVSFSALWIVFHQVALKGVYHPLLSSVIAGLSALVPGFIAAGLIYAVFEDKKLLNLSYGTIYSLYVIVMVVLITMFKLLSGQVWFGTSTPKMEAWVASVAVMILHIPSALLIIGIPIYSTVKTKETTEVSYLMTAGGFLIGVVGTLLAFVLIGYGDPFITMGLFPIVLLFAAACFVFGVILEPKWRIEVPGVQFEEVREIRLELPTGISRPGAITSLIGSILLFSVSLLLFPLTFPVFKSAYGTYISVFLAVAVPMIFGFLGIVLNLSRSNIAKYLLLVVGILAVGIMAFVLFLWMAGVHGGIFNFVFLINYLMACLILIGSILKFAVKE